MKRWLVNMMSKFERFMRYRYGQDQLNNFLAGCYLVLLLIRTFSKIQIVVVVSYTLLSLLLIAIVYRFFSKKKIQRSRENHHYLNFKYKIRAFFRRYTNRFSNRSTYKYFKCPNCQQQLRVPKKRGKVSVTCPKCHHVFDQKT